MFRTVQIVLGVIGILLALAGDRLSIPTLTYGGIAFFGLALMAIGWEAIFTRHIVLGSQRRGTSGTYTGIAAMAQGFQFNSIGLFLFGIAIAMYFNTGDSIFQYMVRRPGLTLMVIGIVCLMQAVISISGSREQRDGPRWIVTLNLLFSRMLPGLILLVIGLGAAGLGLFEFIMPNAFDEMGGGFLEMLYGLR
jgi:hypothetical protein